MRHRNSRGFREIEMRDKESYDRLEAGTTGRQGAAKDSKDRAHNGEMVARDPKCKSRLSCWSTAIKRRWLCLDRKPTPPAELNQPCLLHHAPGLNLWITRGRA